MKFLSDVDQEIQIQIISTKNLAVI